MDVPLKRQKIFFLTYISKCIFLFECLAINTQTSVDMFSIYKHSSLEAAGYGLGAEQGGGRPKAEPLRS